MRDAKQLLEWSESRRQIESKVDEAIRRTVDVGDEFVSPEGVSIKVTAIRVVNLNQKDPSVTITYTFKDGKVKAGEETIGIKNFKDNFDF